MLLLKVSVLLASAIVFAVSVTCTGAAASGNGKTPVILSVRPDSGPPGTLVTVSGHNFTPTAGFRGSPNSDQDYGGNSIRLGSAATVQHINSTDGTTLQFALPENLRPGKYAVTVTNSNGVSNSVSFTATASPK